MPRPHVIQILKQLPQTNCLECGEPTCMVFANRVAEGVNDSDGCPALPPEAKAALGDYMRPFALETDGAPW